MHAAFEPGATQLLVVAAPAHCWPRSLREMTSQQHSMRLRGHRERSCFLARRAWKCLDACGVSRKHINWDQRV